MLEQHFQVGDILARDDKYYGLIVYAYYNLSSIYLKVLNTNSDVRQLNMMYSPKKYYSYKVINV
jgi:hypothetical protein